MSILRQIFETLREYYAANPDYLWWSKNPVEVILGAVLVPGSTWHSVDKVLNEFRTKGLLDFNKIILLSGEELAALIRPVGFQTKKTMRLQTLIQLILDRSGGDLDRYFSRDVEVVRRELLSISGIGHSTADNILLYAGQVPIYMVDTFTDRILKRHGIVNFHANEAQIQELIHQELTPDEEPYGAKLFQKMQELLVRLGREFCDKSRPDCFHCPLNIYLPDGGAVELSKKPIPQPIKTNAPLQKTPVRIPKSVETTNLNETEQKIVETIGEEPMPIDEVVHAVQLPVHIVRATIAVLQMKKIVCQVEGNQVRRILNGSQIRVKMSVD